MKRWMVGIIAVMGAALIGFGIPALAQPASETPRETEGARSPWHSEFVARLADELGITEQRVSDALDTVRADLRAEHEAQRLDHLKERLDAAVADGRLTQEQADAVLEAAESGVFAGGMGRHGLRGPRHFGRGFGSGRGGGGPWGWDEKSDTEAESSRFLLPGTAEDGSI